MSDTKFVLVRNDTVYEVFAERPLWADALDVREVQGFPNIAQGWHATGPNTFEAPGPIEPVVPAAVTSAQAKIALQRASYLIPARQALEALADPEADIWFTDARSWERRSPYVAQVGEALGLGPSEIDDLFRQAAQIAA